MDYMETEDAQDVGRTRDVVDEEKENDEDALSTKDVLSTAQQKVSTDRPIVSTNGSKVSTDRQKDSTDKQNEGTDDQIEGTDEQSKGTDDHTEEGVLLKTTQHLRKNRGDRLLTENILPQQRSERLFRNRTPVQRINEKSNDVPIKRSVEDFISISAHALKMKAPDQKVENDLMKELILKNENARTKEKVIKKKKGPEKENVLPAAEIYSVWDSHEGTDKPKVSTDQLNVSTDKLDEDTTEPKNGNSDENATPTVFGDDETRLLELMLIAFQEEEREKFTIEDRDKLLHGTIDAQRRFLAQQRVAEIRNYNVADLLTKAFDVTSTIRGEAHDVYYALKYDWENLYNQTKSVKHIGKSKEVRTLRYHSLVVPLIKVGDEAIHKELGDRMERAATTASSFEAEDDSDAQTRFEAASKSPMIHLSQEVTHLEVGRTEAIKSRFGGNDKSKKMQKYILKQQFEGFFVSNSEGLHKGYDRTKPGVESLSFDDLYNNLRVFEYDVKGSTASSSSTQNVAFVSENTSSTNEFSTAYGASNSSGHNPQKEGSSSYTDELMYSFFANQSSSP
ncbi:hypothetical protein Tco_0040357 [Tanacetum coccineum]